MRQGEERMVHFEKIDPEKCCLSTSHETLKHGMYNSENVKTNNIYTIILGTYIIINIKRNLKINLYFFDSISLILPR